MATRRDKYRVFIYFIMLVFSTIPLYSVVGIVYAEYPSRPILLNTQHTELSFFVEDKLLILPPGDGIPIESGSRICIESKIIYLQPDTRLVFRGWLIDRVFASRDNCIVLSSPGTYTPDYIEEYLVQVVIEATGEVYSFWVEKGSLFTFNAPREILSVDVLYRFSSWSTGIDPDNSTLTLPITSPTTVKAFYKKFYPVKIYGANGAVVDTKIVEAGATVVIKMEEIIDYGNGTRSVLEDLKIIGNGDAIEVVPGTYIVRVDGVLDILPVYSTYYRVVVEDPTGSEEYWVRKGSIFEEKARETITLSTNIRLRFRGWEGEIQSNTPSLSLSIEKPVRVRAVYTREYKIEIEGPLGTKELWLEEDTKFPVYLPEKLPGVISSRTLKGYIVNGEYRELGQRKILMLDIDKPYKLVAIYEVEIEWVNVLILAGIVLSAIALYLVYEYITTRKTKIS